MDIFKGENGELYYKGKKSLTKRNEDLRTIGSIADSLGIEGLREMGFDIHETSLAPRQALNMMERWEKWKPPSESDIANADDIEMSDTYRDTSRRIEDSVTEMKETQTNESIENPLHELLGFDKELKRIRGQLKVAVSKKLDLGEKIEKEKGKLAEIENHPDYTDVQCEDIRKRTERLNDELKARQEHFGLLKGDLMNQTTSIKEMIAKVLNKDTSLAEKIRALFREQGITIASVLMAIGMAIGVLIEALPGGSGAVSSGGNPPKGEKGLKEWLRNKLKALESLLGRLGVKAAEALPGIIGAIISWILNRAKEVVGWVSQNLWALVVGVGGLIYTYVVTRK